MIDTTQLTYSAKNRSEELVVAFENTYGLPAIITHTMNVFGERQMLKNTYPWLLKSQRQWY